MEEIILLYPECNKDDQSAPIFDFSIGFFEPVDGDCEATAPAPEEEQSRKGAGRPGRSYLVGRLETGSEIHQKRHAS